MNINAIIIATKKAIFPFYIKIVAFNNYLIGLKEKKRGLDFSEHASLDQLGLNSKISNQYEPTKISKLKKIFSLINISNNDSILDFGCGKGRTIHYMNNFPFSQIDGVEISDKLSEIANNNMKILNLENTSIFNSDAANFKQLNTYNHFYFYNPFPIYVFKCVIDNIVESLIEHPRVITLIYVEPTCHDIIISNSVFSEVISRKRFKIYRNNLC
jgi:SAM-dependent methyltransferase